VTSEASRPRVAVVGLGYVGLCLAVAMAGEGVQVVGVDRASQLVDELAAGVCRLHEPGVEEGLGIALRSGCLTVTSDLAAVSGADVVLITVGTPVKQDGCFDDEQLAAACRSVGAHLSAGTLVVVKSTVPPRTTRTLVQPLLESGGLRAGEDFHLVFSPERLAEGNALHEIRSFPIAVGGLAACCTEAGALFWESSLGVAVHRLASLESAEIVKLADNWWIDLNIALANELAKYCSLYGVDVLDVIRAANSIPKGTGNVNILLPSVGVGGSCLTKDPWMVVTSAAEHGLEINTAATGRAVNDAMPEYTANRIIDELARLGKKSSTVTIAILGVAFKNNTGDVRSTPVLGAVEALRKAGAEVRLFDPLVDPVQARQLFGIPLTEDLGAAVRGADCLAILAMHNEFRDVDFAALDVAENCLVFDGRAYFPHEVVARLTGLGYVYQGIGR
jgi:dTDP-alpha-D-glucose dehydrogenase